MATNKKITSPPDSFSDRNKWADYIELLCITSIDKNVALDDIYDMLFGDKSDDEIDNENEDDDEINPDEAISEKKDKKKTKISDIFEFLKSREILFGEFYPFKISNSPLYIQMKSSQTFKHLSYLGLLASSNLDYLKTFQSSLTTNFERNSIFVFKKLFPIEADVEYFGKGNARGKVFTENKLSARIRQLSEVLNVPLSPVFDDTEVNDSNTGDGGLDIVGWINFEDNNNGKVINFAQCACGRDWYNKQFEIHDARWRTFLYINQPILRTLITPSSFRRYDGNWFKQMKIYDCILIDRLRFLKSLRKKENTKVALSNGQIIEEVISWNNEYFN